MNLQDQFFTKQDFIDSDCESIISEAERKDCHSYGLVFLRRINENNASRYRSKDYVFGFLAHICMPKLEVGYENEHKPINIDYIEPLVRNNIDVLKEWVNEISDVELKARIADVLWMTNRDYRMARLAMDSYLKSALRLEDVWISCCPRLERVLRLSLKLNQENYKNKAVDTIDNLIDKYRKNDSSFLSCNLMELMLKNELGDPSKYLTYACKAAKRFEEKQDLYKARHYWRTAKKCCSKNEDTANMENIINKIAKKLNSEADKSTNYSIASHNLMRAVHELRKSGSESARRKRKKLHKKLLTYQNKSASETITIKHETNIDDLVGIAKEQVRNQNLKDSLIRLVLIVNPSDFEELKSEQEQLDNDYPLSRLMSPLITDEQGKVVACGDSIENKVFMHAITCQAIKVRGLIEPALNQVNLEHNVNFDAIYILISNSSFVPKGREYSFAKGLYEGVKGDFWFACHILMPQIENSIREIMTQQGYITSSLSDYGIQEYHNINTFFRDRKPDLEKIFGKNITFDLEGLLVRRSGSNLRNNISHGLMPDREINHTSFVYLWWLTFYLCLNPIIAAMQRSQSENH
jgi:hypothetical protein